MSKQSLAMVGLGVMGRNLALNLRDHGYRVVAFDENEAVRAAFAARGEPDVVVADSLAAAMADLPRPRRVVVLVPAGDPVDQVVGQLRPLLSEGDAIIDGGNTRYRDTQRREADLRRDGISFVGMGVSGGELGARRGPSLMPGGSEAAWQLLKEPFEAIAAQSDAGPCVTHVGANGAGHFVKMVHNGIEYGDMQLIAEAYDLLRRGSGKSAAAISDDFGRLNAGPLGSYLVELTQTVLRRIDERTGAPLVDVVLDRAEQKGTGKWTVETALELGVAIPTISAAVDARLLSSDAERRSLLQRVVPRSGGLNDGPAALSLDDLESALLVGKIAAYAQGFELIDVASRLENWSINKAEVARIWKAGCIIRARLLDRIRGAYQSNANLSHLFFDAELRATMQRALPALQRVTSWAALRALPTPALSATLTYVLSLTDAHLPQNLIQAQRDAFGGHTYERRDDVEPTRHHSDWFVSSASPPPGIAATPGETTQDRGDAP